MKIIMMYLPVPHRGYKEFFKRHVDAKQIFIFNNDLIQEFSHLRKNLPALEPEEVVEAVNAMRWTFLPIELVSPKIFSISNTDSTRVYMPDEDVSRAVADKYLTKCQVIFDQAFLRWDKIATTRKVDVYPDCEISFDDFDRKVISFLDKEKEKSADFWRQVAAAVIKDREVILFGHNSHVPDFESPYFYGDPRFNFSRGVNIDLSTAEHAEQKLISQCARRGIVTEGASLYVTTFPCPPCAKAIASAGFAKCYFSEGYSMMDSDAILRAAGVQLVLIK